MRKIIGLLGALALAIGILGGAGAASVVTAEPASALTTTSQHTQKMRVFSIEKGAWRTEYWKWEYRNYSPWETFWASYKVDGWYTKSYGAQGRYLNEWNYWGKTKPAGSFVYVTVRY